MNEVHNLNAFRRHVIEGDPHSGGVGYDLHID